VLPCVISASSEGAASKFNLPSRLLGPNFEARIDEFSQEALAKVSNGINLTDAVAVLVASDDLLGDAQLMVGRSWTALAPAAPALKQVYEMFAPLERYWSDTEAGMLRLISEPADVALTIQVVNRLHDFASVMSRLSFTLHRILDSVSNLIETFDQVLSMVASDGNDFLDGFGRPSALTHVDGSLSQAESAAALHIRSC